MCLCTCTCTSLDMQRLGRLWVQLPGLLSAACTLGPGHFLEQSMPSMGCLPLPVSWDSVCCPLSMMGHPPSPAQSGLQNKPQSSPFLLSARSNTCRTSWYQSFKANYFGGKVQGVAGRLTTLPRKVGAFIIRGKIVRSGPKITQVGTSEKVKVPQYSNSNWAEARIEGGCL